MTEDYSYLPPLPTVQKPLALAMMVAKRHDPERDMIPGAPDVTWAEYYLSRVVIEQDRQIRGLQDEIAELRRQFDDLEGRFEVFRREVQAMNTTGDF